MEESREPVPPAETKDELQKHEELEQEVPLEMNDQIQEQHEQDQQQIPPELNDEFQEQEQDQQRVPPELNDGIQEQQDQVQQNVHPEMNDEIQEQEEHDQQDVTPEINGEIQEQQERGQQDVPPEMNDEIQDQQEQHQQDVPPEINDEIQEKEEQDRPQFPPEISEEIQEQQKQRQQAPPGTNDEIQEQQEQEDQAQFPPKSVFFERNKTEYCIREIIGTSDHRSITVHKAACIMRDPSHPTLNLRYITSLKLVKAVQGSEDYNILLKRVKRSILLPSYKFPHLNILGTRCFFIDKGIFCVAFLYMDGSLRTLMRSKFPNGIPQEYIIVVLKQALEGLHFLHQNGQLHGEISAGQIFYEKTRIRLSFAATVYDHGADDDATGYIPMNASGYFPLKYMFAWASAPEVHDSQDNRFTDPKSDIWMIGITALELACGEVKIRDRGHLMSILNKIKHEQKLFPLRGDPYSLPWKQVVGWLDHFKKSIDTFEKFVCRCLATDPAKRPTASELLDSKLFQTTEVDLYSLDNFFKQ